MLRGSQRRHYRCGGGAGRGTFNAPAPFFFFWRRAQLNALGSIWYCFSVLAGEAYLTSSSINRFHRYVALPWPDNHQPLFELNLYVGLVGAAVVLLPFFAVSCLVKVGNLANDGHKLGSREDYRIFSSSPSSRSRSTFVCTNGRLMRALNTLWRHWGPTAPLLHILSAFFLLFPKVLIEAKLIKHGFQPKEAVWQTDLDFMVPQKDRLAVLGFLDTIPRSNSTNHGATNNASLADNETQPMSAEFVNYMVAMLVYSVRYGAVFWRTNRIFAFLFSLQSVLGCLQSAVSFSSIHVLYKLRMSTSVGLATDNSMDNNRNDEFLLSPLAVLFLFLCSSLTLALFGNTVYFYGYQRLTSSRIRDKVRHVTSSKNETTSVSTSVPTNGISRALVDYIPHGLALALLVTSAVTSAPILYDYTVAYRVTLDGAILAGLVSTLLYLFFWITLWLVFTLRQHKWQFVMYHASVTSPGGGVYNGIIPRVISASGDHVEEMEMRRRRGAPLLVIADGRSYAVRDAAQKRAIMAIVRDLCPVHGCRAPPLDDDHDDADIYWLKPKPITPTKSDQQWVTKKRTSPRTKHKVTFEDSLLLGGAEEMGGASDLGAGATNKNCKSSGCVYVENITDSETDGYADGEYATLRENPSVPKFLEEDCDVTASTQAQKNYKKTEETGNGASAEEKQRLLSDHFQPISNQISVDVTVHGSQNANGSATALAINVDKSDNFRYQAAILDPNNKQLVRMTKNRSDSPEPETGSCSPPEKNSETSSGIHSNSSICDNVPGSSCSRRSSSMDDLHSECCGTTMANAETGSACAQGVMPSAWKSHSLQRPTDTVVIMRKQCTRANSTNKTEEAIGPFGRSTNMRLTSFADPDVAYRRQCAPLVTPSPTSNQHRDSANYSLTSSGDSDI